MPNLPRLVPYEKIIRGKLFSVAVPFTSERPLDFIVADDSNKGTYKIVS